MLSKVPTLNSVEVYGFFQGLLSVEQMKKMLDVANKKMKVVTSAAQFPVGLVKVAPTTSMKTFASTSTEEYDDDTEEYDDDYAPPMMIPLDVMAKRVYTTL